MAQLDGRIVLITGAARGIGDEHDAAIKLGHEPSSQIGRAHV